MANTIKLKQGSGSDPSASDLALGEPAVSTDTGEIFLKKDDGSIAKVAGGIDDGDKGDITVSNSGATFTIDSLAVTRGKIADNAINMAKFQDLDQNNIVGRIASGSGDATALTAANVRTMINVADGATNVTNTNQLTNGAGFITATLTNEQVQDIVGGMVTGNTETGISVTYQDGDGTLDFVVGTLNQNTTGSSGSCTGNSATATKLATARTIAGVSFDGSANISLNNNAITNGAGYITSADGGNAATLDSLDSTSFLRSDAADTASGDITFSGGAGAVTIAVDSDMRFGNSSSWTGDSTGKIQQLNNILYIAGGTAGIIFRESGTNRWSIDGSGHFEPAADSTYDIGENALRVRNGYFDTLYGDGSNLTNLPSQTDNNFTNSDHSKLDGIESGATADQTASEILTLLKTVDGSGSGLDADTLDGVSSGSFLRSDTTDSASGNLSFTGNMLMFVASITNGILELKSSIATTRTFTSDYNGLSVSPTINSGVTVTVPSGAVWAIV